MDERATILIVDDDDVDRMAVRRALRNTGWQLTFAEAEDGSTALAAVQRDRFDCIILDYMLPGTDGLTVLREIRALGVTTPVVMLTGQRDEQLIVTLIKAGAEDYLPKGKLDPDELWQRVRSAMRVARAREQTNEAETLRVAAETARQQSEHLMATTLRSIGDAVIASDYAGRITFMNTIAEQMTGWSADEAQGRDVRDVFHIVNEDTRAEVESPVSKALREGAIVGLANHTLLISRHGREYPIDDSGAPIYNSEGAIIGVVMVFRDISDRKAAENALRESEARFRTMADSAPVLLWMSEPNGQYSFFNQRWLRFTGRTLEQEVGNGWLEQVHPDDRDPRIQTYDTAFKHHRGFEMEYRLRRHDGQYRWILDTGTPRFTPNGQFQGFIGSCIDFTHRKLAEDRLRFLAEASRLLSSTPDYELRLAHVVQLAVPFIADICAIDLLNEDGSLRRLAVESTDQQLVEREQQVREQIIPPVEQRRGVFAVLRTGESFFTNTIDDRLLQDIAFNEQHLSMLRQRNMRSLIIVPMFSQGRPFGTIGLSLTSSGRTYDEDDLRLAEDLARRVAVAIDNAWLYREAQEAVRARDAFLSIAAHELKTPLTSLMGYADLLRRRAERDASINERDLRAMRVITQQAARLNRMISSLLDLSRIQTGQLSIEHSQVDLVQLVKRLGDEIQPTIQHYTLEIETPTEPLLVEGDELRLEQVIQNLIQNAVKYSSAGSLVRVHVYRETSSARIDVIDQGVGIPEDALPRIFSRFYRADNFDAQRISGMGVGLFVVKEIVTLHGGSVTVQSRVGEGSIFTITLPLIDAPESLPK